MLSTSSWMSRTGKRAVPAVALIVACVAVSSSTAAAQWRKLPSGVSRPGRSARPELPAAAAPAPVRDRYPARATYGIRGVLVGVGVAIATPIAIVASGNGSDCMCGIELPFTVPVGALLGGAVGLAVWDVRFAPRVSADPLPTLASGLVRYMVIGAAAGGAAGAGATYLDSCESCSPSRELVQNVPLGAAVGAVAGAVVYGVTHRARQPAPGR